ncbi:ribonuclease P protein component [Candidatus Thiosymbion oneisti]|uniref:ribonuclease P protein component n=1 Tax=Candidatus Thiosymbion oneisti TaxID=589554 RepID=UPI002108D1D1|nr:ribonuclease P protein component [Candidatus Thiosymbion oneisti]
MRVSQPDHQGPQRSPPQKSPIDTCFPHQARLRRSGDFRSLFAQPVTSTDSCFAVFAQRNGRKPGRLGLAISKRYARRAVDRSRMKRIVRESFRQHRHSLQGIDLAVLCRPHAVTLPNSRLFSSLAAHWKRVRERLCVVC